MPETKSNGNVVLKNYFVHTSFYKRVTKPQGVVEEILIEKDVEIGMLSRASAQHTIFATKLLDSVQKTSFEELNPIAKRFCEMMIVNDSDRKPIVEDAMACIDIFTSDKVQEDIERFLSRWGVVERLKEVNNTPKKD